jgi:hypothetical protein
MQNKTITSRAFRIALIVVPVLVPLVLIVQMLCDVEYQGHDITAHGLGIFSWLKTSKGKTAHLDSSEINKDGISEGKEPAARTRENEAAELFVEKEKRLNPRFIRQGAVFDCRFLATVASLSATERGRKIILDSVKRQPDGNFLVNFAGVKKEIVVSPLSERERRLYAVATSLDGSERSDGSELFDESDRAERKNRQDGGCWLPILEKAYGTWRSEIQDPWHLFLRPIKHFILDGRLTAQPELPGFGAAYGATDDSAAPAFTGHELQSYSTFSFDCGDFGLGKGYVTARQLESWLGRETVRKKYIEEQDKLLTKLQQDSLVGIATTELSTKARLYGLRTGHAYAVIGYQTQIKVVTLKDPYGNGDFKNSENGECFDKVDDGIFQLSLHDFNELFSHLRVESSR